MRNTLVALCVLSLIIGFSGGFTVARLRYKPLLLSNSAQIIALDGEITTLKQKEKMSVQKVAAETGTTYKMVNTQMVVEKSGSSSAVTKDVTLADGTKIMVNGTVVRKDGTKIKLSDGESFGVK